MTLYNSFLPEVILQIGFYLQYGIIARGASSAACTSSHRQFSLAPSWGRSWFTSCYDFSVLVTDYSWPVGSIDLMHWRHPAAIFEVNRWRNNQNAHRLTNEQSPFDLNAGAPYWNDVMCIRSIKSRSFSWTRVLFWSCMFKYPTTTPTVAQFVHHQTDKSARI